MNTSHLYEIRRGASFFRMFSDYLTRKYSPNILVRFGSDFDIDNQTKFCQTLRKIVSDFYGADRFVVYSVVNQDLKCDSRTWCAAAIINLSIRNNDFLIPSINLESKMLNNENELRKKLYDFFNENIEPIKMAISTEQELKPTKIYSFYNSPNRNNNFVEIENIFNFQKYFSSLKTSGSFGRNIRFQEITDTTMELIKEMKHINGSLAICNYQLSGVARNQNQWLSPVGCAMWTVNLAFSINDLLFNRLCLLQHIASLSVLRAIPRYNKLGISIKWPNDIIYVKTKSKLCGIIVKSELGGPMVSVQIGIGLNLSNKYPSICLDDLIKNYNSSSNETNIELISREELIANFMNHFQAILSQVITDDGLKCFKEDYIDNWVHVDSFVKIQDKRYGMDIERNAKIISIDDRGFLQVLLDGSKDVLSLQSDGNRFDLMNNLVILNN